MKRNIVETLVGALVLVVAAVFAYFAYTVTGVGGVRNTYDIVAVFQKVDGLGVGADVRISGIKVGTVSSVVLDPKTYQAKVSVRLPESVPVPADSVAQIGSDGLLGGKYLALLPGNADDNLKAGERIRFTNPSVDLMDLLGRFIFSAADDKSKGSNAPPPPPRP